MSFTVVFDEEVLSFELNLGQDSVKAEAIAEQIRSDKNVIKGYISRIGNTGKRVTSCCNSCAYKFVNYETRSSK